MKACTQCLATKALTEFPRDGGARDGHRSNCKACQSVRNRQQYEAHREKRLAYRHAYYSANREKLIEEMRAYDEANREAKFARGRAWREAHGEEAAANTRAWRAANPEKCRGYAQLKRARKRAAPSERIDPAKVYARDEGFCGICKEATDPNDWHLDHVVPLSRGGHHTYNNVQVAHPRCNIRKGAKLPQELKETAHA